jgi:uncharacterized LabA/DUF88 family protein
MVAGDCVSPAFAFCEAPMKRACVFVDGENFRHSLVELFAPPVFSQSEYLPRATDWGSFYNWLVNQVSPQLDRIRTYWYVIQDIDFYPYHFPDVDKEPERLKALLCQDAGIKAELAAISDPVQQKAMLREVTERLINKQIAMRRRFDGWHTLQNGIAAAHDAIEFRRAGAIAYGLFDQRLGVEKAVDVKLATDLIILRDIYDVAIIVSGDQDYVPAVQVVKDSGKTVVNVAFETRSGKLLPGGARRLNQSTDRSLRIKHHDLSLQLGFTKPAS